MIYKKQDIDRIFTEKVSELLAQGYQINTAMMGDSWNQEIAKIDLIKDNEIWRVALVRSNERKHDKFDVLIIKVLSKALGSSCSQIVYTHDMHVVSQIEFGSAGYKYSHKDVWMDIDSAFLSAQKRDARRQARRMPHRHRMPDSAKSIALRWIRKQKGCKSCRLGEIESVVRVDDKTTRKLYCYEIKARGKTFHWYPLPA